MCGRQLTPPIFFFIVQHCAALNCWRWQERSRMQRVAIVLWNVADSFRWRWHQTACLEAENSDLRCPPDHVRETDALGWFLFTCKTVMSCCGFSLSPACNWVDWLALKQNSQQKCRPVSSWNAAGALVDAKRNAQALCPKYTCMQLYCLFRQQLEKQNLQKEDKLPCNSFSL